MVKIAGVYDANRNEIKRIFTEVGENALIPSPDWVTIAQGGGVKGFMDLVPLTLYQKRLNSFMIREIGQSKFFTKLRDYLI